MYFLTHYVQFSSVQFSSVQFSSGQHVRYLSEEHTWEVKLPHKQNVSHSFAYEVASLHRCVLTYKYR